MVYDFPTSSRFASTASVKPLQSTVALAADKSFAWAGRAQTIVASVRAKTARVLFLGSPGGSSPVRGRSYALHFLTHRKYLRAPYFQRFIELSSICCT